MTHLAPERGPRVLHGDVSQIAGESPKTSAALWFVVFAAGGVDVVTFYQVLVLVLNVPEWMVWISVVGFAVVALTLAHYVGRQARQATNPRNVTGSVTAGWIFAAIWFLLGATAFIVRYVISLPSSAGDSTFVVEGAAQSTIADNADATSQRLSAVLFLVLYVATGTVAALHGFFRPDPAVRQYGRALNRRSDAARSHAHSSSRLSFATQTLQSIERARQRRGHSWERAQSQCTAAADRLKQEARLLLTTHRGRPAHPYVPPDPDSPPPPPQPVVPPQPSGPDGPEPEYPPSDATLPEGTAEPRPDLADDVADPTLEPTRELRFPTEGPR